MTKKKYKWNIKKFLSNLFTAVSVAVIVWVLASYIDVITHNLTTCVYAKWNIFPMIFG